MSEYKTLTEMARAVEYQPTRYEAALLDEISRLVARLAESDRLLRAAIADRESAWNAFYEQQARLAEAVTVLRTIRSMATLPQGLDARAFSVIMGTADSAPAVEMQPGSPSFDGAAAYGRYLDATVSASPAPKADFCCIHAMEAAKKEAWWKRDDDCDCDERESCEKCYPVEFRPGGYWEQQRAALTVSVAPEVKS